MVDDGVRLSEQEPLASVESPRDGDYLNAKRSNFANIAERVCNEDTVAWSGMEITKHHPDLIGLAGSDVRAEDVAHRVIEAVLTQVSGDRCRQST